MYITAEEAKEFENLKENKFKIDRYNAIAKDGVFIDLVSHYSKGKVSIKISAKELSGGIKAKLEKIISKLTKYHVKKALEERDYQLNVALQQAMVGYTVKGEEGYKPHNGRCVIKTQALLDEPPRLYENNVNSIALKGRQINMFQDLVDESTWPNMVHKSTLQKILNLKIDK